MISFVLDRKKNGSRLPRNYIHFQERYDRSALTFPEEDGNRC